MAIYENTTALANTIDLKWDMDLLEARYATAVIMPRVLNKSANVKSSGSQVAIQVKPKYTTGTVTSATGAYTPLNTAPTQVNVVVNVWSYVAVEITDQGQAQSFWDPTNGFAADAGAALAIEQDQTLASLYSSLTGLTEVGDPENPSAFGPDQARIAMLRMTDANIPTDSLTWILPPVGLYMGWLAVEQLTAAMAAGTSTNVLSTGTKKSVSILGSPAYISTVLSSTNNGGTRKALLLHKEAFAIATQRNHEYRLVDRASAGYLSKVAVVDSLYGVRAVRTDHGVVINVKAV